MTAPVSIAGRGDWLDDRHLQKLLSALSADGELARIAGGAVRNALLGQPVADIDIATTTLPDETMRRVKAAGFKAVPTGIEHGTVTAVVDGVEPDSSPVHPAVIPIASSPSTSPTSRNIDRIVPGRCSEISPLPRARARPACDRRRART